MKEKIASTLSALMPELISFRRALHEHPERSGEEFETTKRLLEALSRHGIAAQAIGGGPGVCAVIAGNGGGRTIAYRADIDALPVEEKSGLPFASRVPGCMHACGHDIHATVLLGTGIILNQLRDAWRGNVKLIFQSSEENLSGAKRAIAQGVMQNPDVDCILALHTWPDLPAGTIGLKKGPMMASSSSVKFRVDGKGGHAAHPHKAVDPVTIAAYTVAALQTVVSRSVAPLDSAVLTFGKLSAGSAANVIPDDAVAEGTVRTLREETDRLMEERIRRIVAQQAESFGASAEVVYERVCPPVANDAAIVDAVEASAAQSIGAEQVRWLDQPSMGSEDFANYLALVPGALFRLGTQCEAEATKLPLHNGGIVFDETSIGTGVSFMSRAIVSLLETL